jgi:hypothetical protein
LVEGGEETWFGGGPGDGGDAWFEAEAAEGGFQGQVVAAVPVQFGGDFDQAAAAV